MGNAMTRRQGSPGNTGLFFYSAKVVVILGVTGAGMGRLMVVSSVIPRE